MPSQKQARSRTLKSYKQYEQDLIRQKVDELRREEEGLDDLVLSITEQLYEYLAKLHLIDSESKLGPNVKTTKRAK